VGSIDCFREDHGASLICCGILLTLRHHAHAGTEIAYCLIDQDHVLNKAGNARYQNASILLLEDDDQFASILQEFLELYSLQSDAVKTSRRAAKNCYRVL